LIISLGDYKALMTRSIHLVYSTAHRSPRKLLNRQLVNEFLLSLNLANFFSVIRVLVIAIQLLELKCM